MKRFVSGRHLPAAVMVLIAVIALAFQNCGPLPDPIKNDQSSTEDIPPPTPVPEEQLTILAAQVQASGTYMTNAPGNAVDGSLITMWNSGGPPPAWIRFDLLAPARITKIQLVVTTNPNGNATHEIWGGAQLASLRKIGELSGSYTDAQMIEWTGDETQIQFIEVRTVASVGWVGWVEIRIFERPE